MSIRTAATAAVASLALVAPIAVSSCRSAPQPAQASVKRLTVLYTGDLHGVTEPCGCTAAVLLGGIDRLGRQIALARADAGGRGLLVDAGNMLASASPVPEARRAQDEASAHVLAEAYQSISFDAVAVGPLDLAFGLDGLTKAQAKGDIPFVSANLKAAAAPWRPWRVVETAGLKVGVFGLTDPDLFGTPPAGVAISPLKAGLEEALSGLAREEVDLVVGLGAVDRRKLRRLLKEVPGVDLFVRAHQTQRDDTARPAGSAWIVEPHEEAQSLGRVRLAISADAQLRPVGLGASERERLNRRRQHLLDTGRSDALAELDAQLAKPDMASIIAPDAGAFTTQLLPVTPELEPIPELAALRTAHNKRLKEINLAHATPPPPLPAGASGYAGVEECALCHDEEEAFWKTTKHGHAVATLVERDKQFDEDCISCHVTGYRKPGGSSLGHLGVLENVQCESCHGPSSLHSDDGEEGSAPTPKVPEAVCKNCHNAKHSPKFEYEVWLPKILGPGHGGQR